MSFVWIAGLNCSVEHQGISALGNLVAFPRVTKKASLTLPEETWEWFDEKAAGNRSELLRYLIGHERSPEREWSNNACLGYSIFGAQKLGCSEEQIRELVRAIYGEFDWKTIEEAKVVHNQSSY